MYVGDTHGRQSKIALAVVYDTYAVCISVRHTPHVQRNQPNSERAWQVPISSKYRPSGSLENFANIGNTSDTLAWLIYPFIPFSSLLYYALVYLV